MLLSVRVLFINVGFWLNQKTNPKVEAIKKSNLLFLKAAIKRVHVHNLNIIQKANAAAVSEANCFAFSGRLS